MSVWYTWISLSLLIFHGLSSIDKVHGSDVDPICDLANVTKVIEAQKFDRESIQEYQDLIPMIRTHCDGKQWDRIINQINYNLGITYLSLGQEPQALKSFNAVIDSDESSFKELSVSRLNELNKKYADWNKISDPASKTDEELFNELYDSISTKLGKPDSMEYLEAKFQEILTISPFSLKVRILYNDFLLDQIADVIDLNFAHKAVENIQTILDKFGNKIELDKRLALHHELAVIQLFILNTQPQVSLRKCLNLDMDYQPCKDLMRVWNQISKVLPQPSRIMNADEYTDFDTEWNKISQFLLDNKRSVVKTYGMKEQNFEVLTKYHNDQIKKVLEERPLSSKTWTYENFDAQTDFMIYLNAALCESLDMQASSKKASKYCYNAMKQSLTPDEIQNLKHYLKTFDSPHIIKELLTALFDTYPHISVNLLHSVAQKLSIAEKKHPGINSAEHWAVLFKFAQDNNLAHSRLKFVKNLANVVTKTYHSIQQQQQQKQQQYFQQMFGNQQQYHQQQQHQQQQQFAEPNIKTDKDYYKILGVDKSATPKDVRRSYLQLTKKFHPDKQKNLNDEQRQKNEEKMAEINEAYEILSDDDKRTKYDNARANSRNSRGAHGFEGHGGFKPFDKSAKYQRKKQN